MEQRTCGEVSIIWMDQVWQNSIRMCRWSLLDWFQSIHSNQHRSYYSLSHRKYHSLVFLHDFVWDSRSNASAVFIHFVHLTKSLRTQCHLMAISSPAGPQVAKYTLLLFVWPACSILAFSPFAQRPLILLWEGSMESRRLREKKGIWLAFPTLAKPSSWCRGQTVSFPFEHWWWHCSRSPPVSSSSDQCGGHAGKG